MKQKYHDDKVFRNQKHGGKTGNCKNLIVHIDLLGMT